MNQQRIAAAGIPWFRNADHYNSCLATFSDSHKLPDTYSQWLKRANHAWEQVQRQGIRPVKAYIDIEDFKAFCAREGLNVDAEGRQRYASVIAYRTVTGEA